MNHILAQNHPYGQRYRRIDLSHKITASDAVSAFVKELAGSGELLPEEVSLQDFRIRTELEAEWVLNMLNTPTSRFAALYNIQSQHQNWQCFDFVPSNLGNGFLFHFVCNQCGRKVKDLYVPDGQFEYHCRVCHRLSYPTAQQKIALRRRAVLNE